MSQKYEKLKNLLMELFQLNQPDLDFGLYRIMHAKSAEVTQFLDQDLLPQVREAFAQYQTADRAGVEAELAKAIEQANGLGVDPESTQKVKDLRAKLADESVDLDSLEGEVYDHLYSFFRRYYSEGDFLAKRVYKPGVYAIPYEGEEVKLHWANRDQYYVKTSEYLSDYAFRLRPDDEANPMRVHFRLVDAAEGEHGNVKAAEGKNRIFVLADPGPSGAGFIEQDDSELVIRFEYRPARLNDWREEQREDKTKLPTQEDATAAASQRVLEVPAPELAVWLSELGRTAPTDANPDRSVFEKHLERYTARNTFDYFIHKDLGGFLRRELDFYIKNEVMHLDDIDKETASRVDQYLSELKIIRLIAGKIIDFLAQLEGFQARLWLKRKFVIETNYLITIDLIPQVLYPAIASNSAQLNEWVELFSIDTIGGDLMSPGYEVPLSVEFLESHPTLVVDTSHFDRDLVEQMVAAIDDIDTRTNGVLVNSDSFHALRLLSRTHTRSIKCLYLDPPYNTDSDDFAYKDSYQHSSWLAMMAALLDTAAGLLLPDFAAFVSIDDTEVAHLRLLLDEILKPEMLFATIAYERSGSAGLGQGGKIVNTKEYILAYAGDKARLNDVVYARPLELKTIRRYNKVLVDQGKRELAFEFASKADGSPVRIYKHSGFKVRTISLRDPGNRMAEILKELSDNFEQVFRTNNVQKENEFQNFLITKMSKDSLYTVEYVPTRGRNKGKVTRLHYLNQELFAWLKDTATLKRGSITKQNKITDHWSHAEIPKADLANEGGVFLSRGKKPEQLLKRLLELGTQEGDLVCDYFVGSGTTAAVAMKMGRRFIGVDNERYFKNKSLRRLKNVLFGEQTGVSAQHKWAGGGLVKYLILESYEDCLNNLGTSRRQTQQSLLDSDATDDALKFREEYMLRYKLDVETNGSPSLLDTRAFRDPSAYQMTAKHPGSDESRVVSVDLLETFNWLIGLKAKHIAARTFHRAEFERDDQQRLRLAGRLSATSDAPWWFRPVSGSTPDGRRALVIWRNLTGNPEEDNLVLDEWFTRQGYSSKESEFDLIYVNGDNNLENLKGPNDTWKVRLIAEQFHRLMFEDT